MYGIKCKRVLSGMALLALAAGMTHCGKMAKVADMLASAPTLSPSSTATPEDAAAVKGTASAINSSVLACATFLSDKSALQSFIDAAIEAGKQKETSGQQVGNSGATGSGTVTQDNCNSTLQDAFEKLGALLARDAVTQDSLSKYVGDLLAWIDKINAKPVPTPAPGEGRALISVYMTAMNAHSLGVCAAGTRFINGIADCGGGACNGTQAACVIDETITFGSSSAGIQVIKSASVTVPGTHANQAACPAGQVPFGLAVDCGPGGCNGIQTACVQFVDASSLKPGDTYVTDMLITYHGTHIGATCPGDHPQQFGGWADCGGGYCLGTQLLCGKLATVPNF